MASTFYQKNYQTFVIILAFAIILMLLLVTTVLYQITHAPLPTFTALDPKGQNLALEVHEEPNFLPGTLTRWASKAAVAAYTFDFANYNKQLAALQPYFTEAGWINYKNSISSLIESVAQNQVFISSVVVGAPVIISQGGLDVNGYSWRIQMPFLVTTQSAETSRSKSYILTLTVVKVPTSTNPVGIGIDQFIMT